MKCWVDFLQVLPAAVESGEELKRGYAQVVGAFLVSGNRKEDRIFHRAKDLSLARRVEECFEHLWKRF